MKNLTPGNAERPCYYSKKGIKLEDGFFWFDFMMDGLKYINICSIQNDKNIACVHGQALITIEELVKKELNGDFIITGNVVFPDSMPK
jgi:hypothetical protein